MQNIEEILTDLKSLWALVNAFVQKVGDQASQENLRPDKWTIAEEFGHMILSAAPIAKVLNTDPKEFLHQDYLKRNSLTYQGLNDLYLDALKHQSTVAPARFIQSKDDISLSKDLIVKWSAIGHNLLDGFAHWNENELDNVQLKHPFLGLLTLREMLFFTHMHTAHHLRCLEQKALALSGLE